MSAIDDVLKSNAQYAEGFSRSGLPIKPRRGLVVVTCMDARIDVLPALGLDVGEAHVIRNAGGLATDDVMRSLIVSLHIAATSEVMVIHHTGCAVLERLDEGLEARLVEQTGRSAASIRADLADDHEENVRRQVQAITSHPWIPAGVVVRGFIYDLDTGRLREIAP